LDLFFFLYDFLLSPSEDFDHTDMDKAVNGLPILIGDRNLIEITDLVGRLEQSPELDLSDCRARHIRFRTDIGRLDLDLQNHRRSGDQADGKKTDENSAYRSDLFHSSSFR
jgi:hypothetical protein